ncbi:MAG: hypothetical protein WC985_08680 [Thermoplasmata archaeon]
MRLAMDTDALIKITKSSLKDLVASSFALVLPEAVRVECVDQGKEGGHPDALRIEENIREGRLSVLRARPGARSERRVRDLGLTGGEADVLRLHGGGGVDAVVSDDRRFLQVLEALGIPFATPSSLLVALARRRRLPRAQALSYLEKLSPLISEEEYLEAKAAIVEA